MNFEVTEIQFYTNYLTLFFAMSCKKCGRGHTHETLDVYRLTTLHVGCSHCSSYPTLSLPLYKFLLDTVENTWNCSPEDVKKIGEKLLHYQNQTA